MTELVEYLKRLDTVHIYALMCNDKAKAKQFHLLRNCEPTPEECMICGPLDCPYDEPLHYDKDGCPKCDV
jgi:hypothetical protein